MGEERYQRELFEFEDQKKGPSKFRLTGILPKSNFAVILTIEKIIFICIALVMAMVVIYALGVETGKARGRTAYSSQERIDLVKKAAVSPVTVKMPAAPQKEPATKPI